MESSSPGLRDEAFPPPNQPSSPTPTQSAQCPFSQEQNQAGATVLSLPLDQQRDEQEPWSLAQLPAAFSSITADDRPPMRNDGGCSGSDEAKEKATEDEHPFPLFALPVSEEQGRDLKHGVPKFHKSTFDDQTFVAEAFNSTQAEAKGGSEKSHLDNDESCYGGTKPGAEFIRTDSDSLSSAFQTETAPVDNRQKSNAELVDHDESKAKRWEFDEETERCDHKRSHAEFIQDQATAGTSESEIPTQSDRQVSMKKPVQEIGATVHDASADDNVKGESDSNLDDDDDDDEWVEGSDSSVGDESDEGSYYSEDDESEGGSDSSDDDESDGGSDSSDGQRMIKFQALCASLSGNDPCITRVADVFHDHMYGLGRPLGNALLCNTCVTHLYLDTTIAYNADSYFDPQEIDDVLSFLRCSKSLRSFDCSVADAWEDGTTLWIDAVAESSRIEEFSLASSREFCCPDAVLRLYQTTTTLKGLELALCRYEDHERHFNAIRNMKTLERLVFFSIDAESIPENTAHMIRNLPCPVNLRSMGLCSDGYGRDDRVAPFPITEAIASFVRASTTLSTFSLTHSFDKKGMLLFLKSLRLNQSIAKLGLHGCCFTDEAADAFALFMKETNGAETTGIVSFRMSNQYLLKVPVFELAAGPRGSGLECLDLSTSGSEPWDNVEALADAPQSPRLSHLKLEYSSGQLYHYRPLFRVLPAMVYLRKLELAYNGDEDCDPEDLQELVDAVRTNGSLHTVALQRQEKSNLSLDVQPWTPEQARLVEAYGQRNQHMPELLSSAASQSCFTSLFLVARHTPRMTLHHVFTGVVTMHDSIGETTATRSDGTLPDTAAIGD